ncbi:hypothetical protein Gotur_018628 [Gossypium turneri]
MNASAASLSACIAITSTNEELFIGLDKLTSGSPLPCNVIEENPYSFEPQHLPDDMWFLTSSNGNTDMEHGLWKVKEEAREVFSNSDFIGWRTTLVYYKGQVSHEHKTNWVMQVFSTTQKRLCDENANKPVWLDNMQETISMCRVFLVPSDEMQEKVSSARIGTENHLPQPPILEANCGTGIGSSSNHQVSYRLHTYFSLVSLHKSFKLRAYSTKLSIWTFCFNIEYIKITKNIMKVPLRHELFIAS